MTEPLLIAKSKTQDIHLLPQLANRHGLITGATGTGKTVTLQKMAESFANIGVPVFMADVKGDLSGVGAAGVESPKLKERLAALGITEFTPRPCTTVFWDVFGEAGHPVRGVIAQRRGWAYRRPPLFHWALRPRGSLRGESAPTLRLKISP